MVKDLVSGPSGYHDGLGTERIRVRFTRGSLLISSTLVL